MSDEASINFSKELCREVVMKCVPQESNMFDAIWDGFWKSVGITTFEALTEPVVFNLFKDPVRVLGAIGGGHTLESIFVIGPMIGAMAALRWRQDCQKVSNRDVKELLASEVERMAVPKYLRKIVVEHGSALLCEALRVHGDMARYSTRDIAEAPIFSGNPLVYVSRRIAGNKVVKNSPWLYLKALAMAKEFAYLIVVDERARTVTITGLKESSIPFNEIVPMRRVILWLMLNQGERLLTSKALDSYRKPPLNRQKTAMNSETFCRHVVDFKGWAGSEVEELLRDDSYGQYEVDLKKLSYFWIHLKPGENESELLHPRLRSSKESP